MARNNYSYEKKLGLSFPLYPSENGNLHSLENTEDVVKQNLVMFFKTEQGQRIMRPNLGVILRRKFGEFITEEVSDDVADSVREQLNREFPKIKVRNVEVEQPELDKFKVTVYYNLKEKINVTEPNKIKIIIQ